MKYAILGAGLTGLTVARLLSNAGHKVVVYEKNQNEFGGMCFEKKDERDGMILITEEGAVSLSEFPRDLFEIEVK